MEKQLPQDQELISVLDGLALEEPELTCQQNNPITQVCINPKCDVALTCSQKNCKSCSKTIKDKNSIFVAFSTYITIVNQPLQQFREFVSKISIIENEHIEQLQKNKRKLVETHSSGLLNIGQEKVIQELYKNKNAQAISGKDAEKFYKKMKGNSNKASARLAKLIQSYGNTVRDITEKMVQLKNSIYDCYSKESELEAQLVSEQSRLARQQRSSLLSMLSSRSMSELSARGDAESSRVSESNYLLDRFDINDLKDMFCESGNQITRICINKDCQKPALLCDNSECLDCGQDAHRNCSNNMLKAVTLSLQGRSKTHSNFVTSLCQVEDSFIGELLDSREGLGSSYYLGGLGQKYVKMVEDIYKKHKNTLKGGQANQFLKELEKTESQADADAVELKQKYREDIARMKLRLVELKRRYYEGFISCGKIPGLRIIPITQSAFTQKQNFELLAGYNNLIAKLSLIQKLFIYTSLNCPKELTLLFRASQHQFKASQFHQHCDNKEDTLTIVRTQFGKTLAAFTHYPWNPANHGSYTNDSGRKTFILQLDLLQKLVPTSDNYLIFYNNTYGPTFGAHTLYISDCCNANSNSYANFSHYNIEGPNPYSNNQQCYTALSGATNNYNFKITEYQVFQVKYD